MNNTDKYDEEGVEEMLKGVYYKSEISKRAHEDIVKEFDQFGMNV